MAGYVGYVGYALSFWFDAAFPDCYLRFKKAQKWAFLNRKYALAIPVIWRSFF
jgi:hypothetical protein